MSVGLAHSTFHREARTSPHLYLHRDPELVRHRYTEESSQRILSLQVPYLLRLVEAGKQLFVITNSPFETVDRQQPGHTLDLFIFSFYWSYSGTEN